MIPVRAVPEIVARGKHTGVVRHQTLDPVVEELPDLGLGRVHVRQCRRNISQPAFFDLSLVAVVLDEAERVEVFLAVERIEDGVIHLAVRTAVALNAESLLASRILPGMFSEYDGEGGPYKMISHDVDHEKHPTGVKGISQSLQVVGSTIFRIQSVSVPKTPLIISTSVL